MDETSVAAKQTLYKLLPKTIRKTKLWEELVRLEDSVDKAGPNSDEMVALCVVNKTLKLMGTSVLVSAGEYGWAVWGVTNLKKMQYPNLSRLVGHTYRAFGISYQSVVKRAKRGRPAGKRPANQPPEKKRRTKDESA